MTSVNPGGLEDHPERLVGGVEAAVRRQHMHQNACMQQLSFRIDLGGKHHRFIAKCLIDLCFVEIKRKKIQSIFSRRSESKPLPASTGLAALAKREHLEHLRVLSGLEWMKGNVGKLSAGRSG